MRAPRLRLAFSWMGTGRWSNRRRFSEISGIKLFSWNVLRVTGVATTRAGITTAVAVGKERGGAFVRESPGAPREQTPLRGTDFGLTDGDTVNGTKKRPPHDVAFS